MKRILLVAFVCLTFFAADAVVASDQGDVSAAVKTILNSIRYGRHDNAMTLVDVEAVCRTLMGSYWAKMTPAEKDELKTNVDILIRKLSFPEGEKLFQHLDAVLYGKPVIKGNKARCKATIVVHRDYKKQETAIDFELSKNSGRWKVVEMYILGEGIFAGIYEDEISPVLKKGGIPAVLNAIRKRVAEVSRY
ncbi:MAG TPA: ABC transporter substrate-binding protein [Spirochaetota bacterium]|nr:ABC transporter substrate-binding protein [Spirochaetota bacterium]HQO40442.1 ABC transporter substrate-binding protein [Spirochaetota bacterium]